MEARLRSCEASMKKTWIWCFVVVLIACGLAWAQDAGEKDVQDLVNQAVEAFKQSDRERVLKLLNASAGPFRKVKGCYIIVLDFNGMMLAHSVRQDMVGKSQWDFVDANGKYIAREQIRVAREKGEGWMEYLWQRPGEAQPTPKRTFVKSVPGENLVVCAGYYVQ